MIELADARTVECRLDHVTLHGVSMGSGPLALAFHGITANAYVFLPLMERLADRFQVVSFDQRGHGRSGKPASGYTAADFATDVEALVASLGGGPALLIGHSLGARNALVAAARSPALVSGVIAVEFTPFIEGDVFDALESRVGAGDQTFADVEAIGRYLRQRYPLLPSDAIDRRVKYGYIELEGGWRPLADPAAMRQTAAGLREEFEASVTGISVPTLLVRGAESTLVSPAAWVRTRALRPDLPAIEIPGADHYAVEEAHAAIAGEIRRFVS